MCQACGNLFHLAVNETGTGYEALGGDGDLTPAEATSSVASHSPAGEDWDSLLYVVHWASSTISFSFPTAASDYPSNYPNGETNTFQALNTVQMTAVRDSLADVSSFTELTFVEVSETSTGGVLRFAESSAPNTAWGYYPNPQEPGGDVWFNPQDYNSPILGNYAYGTVLHEIGHTLGLMHGHDTGNPNGALPYAYDSEEFSLMTYRDHVGDGIDYSENEAWGNSQSYMMFDIAALQYFYGANYSSSGEVWSGDSVYTFSTTTGEMFINGAGQGTPGGNRIFRTVWDGNGTDTYDLSNYSTDLVINLSPGGWSTFSSAQLADLDGGSRSAHLARGNLANALLVEGDTRSLIENAIGGTGNDLLVGNQAANELGGGGGSDQLYGGEGNDTLVGGDGNDLLDGGASADILRGGEGFDTVRYFDSAAGVTVNLTTQQVSGGDAQGDTISGIEAVNGSASGGDTLIGSADGNQLFGFGGNDLILGEGGGDGLYGGDGSDHLYGGEGNDILEGGDGNDLLDGGTYADILRGGAGFDTIRYVDSLAGVSVNLATQQVSGGDAQGDTISGIEAVNGSATGGDILIGSADGNQLFGFGGNDFLSGAGGGDGLYGGDGSDHLYGGEGNDILEGGDGNDLLDGGTYADILRGGAGFDTIRYVDSLAGVSVNLATQQVSGGDAEGDTISGIEAVNGSATGGDILVGSADGNQLFGFGGNDSLSGAGGGDGLYGGDGDDNLDGGEGNDILEGGNGNDLLDGGAGTDTFVFAEFGDTNADTISDYSLSDGDIIRLIGSVFGLATMGVASSLSAVFQDDGVNTQGGDDFLVWDTSEHTLYFDADANGAGAGAEIASLSGSPLSFLIEIV